MTLLYVVPPEKATKKCIVHTYTQYSRKQHIDLDTHTIPPEVIQAFNSVIMFDTNVKCGDWKAAGFPEDTSIMLNPEDLKGLVLREIFPMIRYGFPNLKNRDDTAYISPIITGGAVGSWRGIVAARSSEDAITVAEYLAERLSITERL